MKRSWMVCWVSVLVSVTFLVLNIPYLVVSAEPSAKWITTFGGVGNELAYAAEFGDDDYFLTGITNFSGFGRYDAWLVKTDSSGFMEWNRTYGGLFNDMAYSLTATSDGAVALAGSTNSFGAGLTDIWLVKIDSSGVMEWNQTYGGTGRDSCRSLIATSDGGFALLCSTESLGAGKSDVWLVKVDSCGVMEWNQTYGGIGTESVSTIIETIDGGYALACSTTSFGAGSADFWLIKVDSSGNMEWNQTYGEPGIEFVNSLVATNDGGYVLAGSTSSHGAGSADVWLVKTDSFGNLEWEQTFGGLITDYCDSIVVSGDRYTLACISQDPTYGDGDFWLAEVDSLGNLLWNQTYGVSAHHSETSLLVTADGSYIFGGSTRDDRGNQDFWLAKICETDSGLQSLIYWLIPVLVVLVFVVALIIRRTNKPKNKTYVYTENNEKERLQAYAPPSSIEAR